MSPNAEHLRRDADERSRDQMLIGGLDAHDVRDIQSRLHALSIRVSLRHEQLLIGFDITGFPTSVVVFSVYVRTEDLPRARRAVLGIE